MALVDFWAKRRKCHRQNRPWTTQLGYPILGQVSLLSFLSVGSSYYPLTMIEGTELSLLPADLNFLGLAVLEDLEMVVVLMRAAALWHERFLIS